MAPEHPLQLTCRADPRRKPMKIDAQETFCLDEFRPGKRRRGLVSTIVWISVAEKPACFRLGNGSRSAGGNDSSVPSINCPTPTASARNRNALGECRIVS